MKTDQQTPQPKTDEQFALVDSLASERQELFATAKTGLSSALHAARALYEIKRALTDEVMRPVMALQGSSLGFLSDSIYPEAVVRECIVEASLRGVPIYGNCFNIIGKRFYVTKNGFKFLLAQVDGLEGLALSFSPPVMEEERKLATFEAKATWTLRGKPGSLSKTIQAKVNAGMGVDGALGKAERKLLRDVYEIVSGIPLGDGDAAEPVEKLVVGRAVDAPAPTTTAEPAASQAAEQPTDRRVPSFLRA